MATHFVYNSSSLPPPKADNGQLPARIPTGSQLSAAEFGTILQAIYDIRDTIHSGTFKAFQRSSNTQNPYTGSLPPIGWDLLWVDSAGNLKFRRKTGDVIIVSGSG